MGKEMMEEDSPEAAAEAGADIALMAAGASVLLSWYHFYGRKNHDQGIFIGLWPPTILAFSSYLQQKAMKQKLDRLTGVGGSGLQRVRKMME